MIYQCLNQLKNNQKQVEILIGDGSISLKGKVLYLTFDSVLVSIDLDYGDGEGEKSHEAIIKLSTISCLIYGKELEPFLNEEKEKEHEEEFKKQE